MTKKKLGNSDLEITPIGVGAWAMGGAGWAFSWGPQDDNESIAAIRHASERGMNWIDTAAVYGLGHSEAIVGQALRLIPSSAQPYVFTKCGLSWNHDNPGAEPRRILTPKTVRREIQASLRRLGVERI